MVQRKTKASEVVSRTLAIKIVRKSYEELVDRTALKVARMAWKEAMDVVEPESPRRMSKDVAQVVETHASNVVDMWGDVDEETPITIPVKKIIGTWDDPKIGNIGFVITGSNRPFFRDATYEVAFTSMVADITQDALAYVRGLREQHEA